MDIEGLGERTVAQLTTAGLVGDAADLFALTEEQLLGLEGFATISAQKLLAAIDGARQRPLPRLLTALGIRHLGPAASQVLAAQFGTLDAVMAAPAEELAAVAGVGGVIADAIATWFAQPDNRQFVEKLRAAGVAFGQPVERRGPEFAPVLAGKAVVVSGTLDRVQPGGGDGGDHRPRRHQPRQRQRKDARARRRASSWGVEGRPRPSNSACRSSTSRRSPHLLETGELPSR